ncbi:VOC family protein [Paenibacillus sp. J2TS4]|uniref:VOC family protein n=1 Tax=Paenibacillus sp. J2TS4 TaxID=2807194 RepID=UPI001B0FF8F2|nr:VOC family protein [Paenibacillus sp. J2TS4]GIP31684.1 hypothetical protein J2TS4_08940 [Paenibacillus sp. J2TS4]
MKLRVGAVFIPVIDLEESIAWYTERLGLQLVDHWGAGASFTFKEGEALVALIEVQEPQPLDFPVNPNQSNVYFHMETDDIEHARKVLESKDVVICKYYDHGLMEEIFIKDPTGNQIAIYSEKKESPFYKHASGKISW